MRKVEFNESISYRRLMSSGVIKASTLVLGHSRRSKIILDNRPFVWQVKWCRIGSSIASQYQRDGL